MGQGGSARDVDEATFVVLIFKSRKRGMEEEPSNPESLATSFVGRDLHFQSTSN